MDLGPPEVLLILAVVIIIFGVGKLPEVGSALGKGIREFRKASNETDGQVEKVQATQPPAQLAVGVVCASCGTMNVNDANFCNSCGSPLKKAAVAQNACPHCGILNPGENIFCTSCGSALVEVPVS